VSRNSLRGRKFTIAIISRYGLAVGFKWGTVSSIGIGR
jgi:hypothetical protein